MECDCSVGYYENPEISRITFPIAKKKHTCCECSGDILPGKKYENVRGLWDGEFETFKTCLACSSIRGEYCSHGFVYGELKMVIDECLGVDLV